MNSTMYSLASLAALTLVSVPCTGNANESITTKVSPSILPCAQGSCESSTLDSAERCCAHLHETHDLILPSRASMHDLPTEA